MEHGFSVRIFVPAGHGGAVRIVERSNWSGRGVTCTRAAFPTAQSLFTGAGVYILTDGARLYIGAGDPLLPRLVAHAKTKEFWTSVIAFTGGLNRAHAQYLESRLIRMARPSTENAVAPEPPSLGSADAAEMDEFLGNIVLCLQVLGIAITAPPNDDHTLRLRYKSARATGFLSAGGFTVAAGSTANATVSRSMPRGASDERKRLERRGVLSRRGDVLVFESDHEFSSASTAATIVAGNPLSGLAEWRTLDGRRLRDVDVTARRRMRTSPPSQ